MYVALCVLAVKLFIPLLYAGMTVLTEELVITAQESV